MSNLSEKWNEHMVQGNQLSRELEEFEGIMHAAELPGSVVAFYGPAGSGTTFIDSVLSPEKMIDIKRMVVTSLTEAKLTKEIELEKLMGIRKPAMINLEFEAAVQDMIESGKKQTKEKVIVPDECKTAEGIKPEMIESEVTRLYIDEGKTLKEVADYFGVSKSAVNSYIYRHKLARKTYTKEDNGFRDAEVEQRRRERP